MLDGWMDVHLANSTRFSFARIGGRFTFFRDDESYVKPKRPLQFVPGHGTHWFKTSGTWFRYRNVEEHAPSPRQVTYISCWGRSQRPVRSFLNTCREQYLKDIAKKTLVYENRDRSWIKARARRTRQLHTIILDKSVKETWLRDIEQFLDPKTRAQYMDTGPPGTGKTSATLAIADRFGTDVYKLNLGAGLQSSELNKLLDEVPERSLLLAEDIDAVTSAQARTSHNENDPSPGNTQPAKTESTTISLSDLLNLMDGVASVEGVLLILTTNHPEKLDAALVRPGRIDQMIELGLTTSEVNHDLFHNFYKQVCESAAENDNFYNVSSLAKEFAGKVPQNEFSPAEVLSLFQENMRAPQAAVDGAEDWMAKIRQGRQK
ncbi:P-loop containing nucleoside triphosphate hydrolase protein [Pseudovirgaria hyperparasitica]|uniref:P-loop containing nucleoside triphosphate hydrolase protein n=1 Tax=Pseudovirgaria hyperparasitica TaxID=470096 RepID=A0A6A6VSH3_9PEZI|nr:P-loop containing nucleoside triphosphate hydrolase protein [Pseudovirgaria hyperparasitica]KAF2752704.1 P-loop containing nucleoside triphosphate hydrolase protein [Pseudovirgaria hyperparasitica]